MSIQPHSQDEIDRHEPVSMGFCDDCDERLAIITCTCGQTNLCDPCRLNAETCVICEENCCYKCEVLTEDGYKHEACRDLEPDKGDDNES